MICVQYARLYSNGAILVLIVTSLSSLDFWFAHQKASQQTTEHRRTERRQKAMGRHVTRRAKRDDESSRSRSLGTEEEISPKESCCITAGEDTMVEIEPGRTPQDHGAGTQSSHKAEAQTGLSSPGEGVCWAQSRPHYVVSGRFWPYARDESSKAENLTRNSENNTNFLAIVIIATNKKFRYSDIGN